MSELLYPPIPEKEYSVIYADPPWQQHKGNMRKCRPKQGRELDYQTLPLCTIKTILTEVRKTAKHNLFVWTIDKFLVDTEKMLIDMGYKLHARIVWDKCNGVAPAMTVRYSHEYLLWAYEQGKMLMPTKITRGKYTTVLREPSRKHSQKPICAYEMIENMFPDAQKIEMFARNRRNDWDAWGNEVDRYKIIRGNNHD